jgi:hypothetical protein
MRRSLIFSRRRRSMTEWLVLRRSGREAFFGASAAGSAAGVAVLRMALVDDDWAAVV